MPIEVEVAGTGAGVTKATAAGSKAAAAGATAAAAGATPAAAVTTEAAATAATSKSAVYWVVKGGNKSSYIRGTTEQKKVSRYLLLSCFRKMLCISDNCIRFDF